MSADTVTGHGTRPLPAVASPSATGGSKAGEVVGPEEDATPPSKRKDDYQEKVEGEGEEKFAEKKSSCGEREVMLDGADGLGGSSSTAVVGGGAKGGSKDMQAGFTVLPGGGVHLRLRKWED